MNKLIKWLFCKPNESDLLGVNFREAVQCLFGHTCEWEFRHDVGEEEHGLNYAKRYCKICGKCQRRYFHRFGDIRMTWEDEILPESIKLPHATKK